MTHKMKLDPVPFEVTKEGKKTIEIRLGDEKRRHLKVGDSVEFENTKTLEILMAVVKAIRAYPSMQALVVTEDFVKTGGIYRDHAHWIESINSYYNESAQKKYGLLSIEIELK